MNYRLSSRRPDSRVNSNIIASKTQDVRESISTEISFLKKAESVGPNSGKKELVGSRKKHKRQSNIEALRLIAMFMILVRHAGFYALGMPDNDTNPMSSAQVMLLSILEIFSGVGVNVFILISGYFGIKCNLRSASKFIFQCLFYSCGIFLVLYSLGVIPMTFLGLSECFFLRKINWFPKAYLCLFIFAPMLNVFVDNCSEKQLRNTILSFLIFQTIFGCISEATHFISFGYSTISFFGLYLLARYVRLYPHKIFNISAIKCFGVYFAISSIMSLCAYELIQTGHDAAFYRLNAYCNPLVIISSLYLFLGFTKFRFNSEIVNYIAASCFAVYLFHSNPNIIERFYIATIKYFHVNSGEFELIYIFIFLISVFIFSIILDQLRILLWKLSERVYDAVMSRNSSKVIE